ncbi:hypothetical protein ACWOAH_11310 [Vagococcus vulneris]|uniref:Uncharacterized protein n=1 Tax=Vagococcus vulneris TaxID=1977869 RepID=A0A429ZQ47_9ENTE|nr:hypothetical protein [Vagococcus vulneris]RST95806.1 hypothetical protein CBF37_11335 [Vagococcus vulneris]
MKYIILSQRYHDDSFDLTGSIDIDVPNEHELIIIRKNKAYTIWSQLKANLKTGKFNIIDNNGLVFCQD